MTRVAGIRLQLRCCPSLIPGHTARREDHLVPMAVGRIEDRAALGHRRASPLSRQDKRENEDTPEPDPHSAHSLGQEPVTRHQDLTANECQAPASCYCSTY